MAVSWSPQNTAALSRGGRGWTSESAEAAGNFEARPSGSKEVIEREGLQSLGGDGRYLRQGLSGGGSYGSRPRSRLLKTCQTAGSQSSKQSTDTEVNVKQGGDTGVLEQPELRNLINAP